MFPEQDVKPLGVAFIKVPVILTQLVLLVSKYAPEQLSLEGATAAPVMQILKPFAELVVDPVGLKVVATRT